MEVKKRPLAVCICSLSVSIFLIICGLVLFFIWPVLLDHILSSNFILTPDSPTYQLWKKFPVNFPIDFYFFNWTNPQDIYNKTTKPHFEEVGPYRFYEMKEKSNISWNENGTVTYRHKRTWFFDDKDVKSNLNDPITTVNPVALAASYAAREWSYLVRKGLSLSLTSMSPTVHMTRSAGEMLFEGYKDPMLTMAKTLPFLAGTSLPPWDKFGWFYTRNGSAHFDGIFNMGTGINSEFGKLYRWNYGSETPFFEGECGIVKGSAGEFFKSPKDSISFFSSDMCRSLTLDFQGPSKVENIMGNKYVIGPNLLDNGTLVPENQCYCNGECVPSGTVNISACRYGSPAFASLPHFYNADPYYINLVEGLKPDRNKHEFFITLEPTTGIPLEVSARLQLNLLMQPVSGIALFERVPRVFFPMLYFEQKVKIPENEAFKLKLLLNLPVICSSIGILLICMGLILLLCSVYKACTLNICGRDSRDKYKYKTCEQHVPKIVEHQKL